MVEIEKLKRIFLFQNLPEDLLKTIATVAEIKNFAAGTVLFEQYELLNNFYMLLKGKVLLNCKSSAGTVLTLGEVTPGCSFGVSSFIVGTRSLTNAVCTESSQTITLSGNVLTSLFHEDPKLGFAIMLRVVQLFKFRMDQRTEQFIRSLTSHPTIKEALKHKQ
jgi:CRP-like cAMP-binding protein